MNITTRRKKQFSNEILNKVITPIGFIDVGSGGVLKHPWNLLPGNKIVKYDFEPTSGKESKLPVCISNQNGEAAFFIAEDERASSLHMPSKNFINRFGHKSISTSRIIKVQLNTLDDIFKDKLNYIDLIDINVEGHDSQVLQGASLILSDSNVKLIKIEFELTEVWEQQGWFGDIDFILRSNGYDLANIEIEFTKPLIANHIYYKGEPLWGKAYYTPSLAKWKSKISNMAKEIINDELRKAIVLYTITDLPARALDLLALLEENSNSSTININKFKTRVSWVYAYNLFDNAVKRVIDIFSFILEKMTSFFK